jgi:CheY-like chemotaxis protein
MGLHLETFDVPLLIQEMITTLQPAAAKNHNTIRIKLTENICEMRADITKVRQILFNLLSNACKFTDHGSITVDVDQHIVDGQDWIRFRITDTGIGITARQREHLFEEFAQADTSIARKYGGTGLGLAITYKFVQLMRGHIEVESRPGEGSTFSVTLPVQVRIDAADTVQMQAVLSTPDALSQEKVGADTVLVIDDDPAVRDLMSRCLSKVGFNVVAASNGEEGLRLARQCDPLVITLDVIMPDSDGWVILNKLKSDPQLANIPVIMVTVVDNEAMGFDLGAASYLVKPVDRERLAVLIQKHRDTRSSARARKSDKARSLTNGHKRQHEIIAQAAKRG